MPLRNILGRPSTSASNADGHAKGFGGGNGSSDGNSKRFSIVGPSPTNSPSRKSTKSPERGHRKIGSLQRLSLSFAHGDHIHFPNFLTREPEEMSRPPSKASNHTPEADRQPPPSASDLTPTGLEPNHSLSAPMLSTTSEENESMTDDEPTPRPERFSLLKYKHASEPQLGRRYRDGEPAKDEERPPPPKIITTAPTHRIDDLPPKRTKERFLPKTFNSFRKSMIVKDELPLHQGSLLPGHQLDAGAVSAPDLVPLSNENTVWRPRSDTQSTGYAPPAYGDESSSALALPIARLSESGGSEGSSASHKLYAQTTTTHFIQTTTTIFKMSRNRKKKLKDKGPLFPLPERIPPPGSSRTSMSNTNEADSIHGRKSMSPSRKSTQNVRWRSNLSQREYSIDSPSRSATALTNAPLGSPGPVITRKHSTLSNASGNSTPTGLIPPRLGARGRSSTMGSLGRSSERLHEVPSGRTSTSTAGRKSFGDLLTQRLRKDSAPIRHGSTPSGSNPASKANSFQIARDAEPELVYPQREEEDTPASYLEKLDAAIPRGAMATILCKQPDEFSTICLRKYMRGFSYFGESIDMSIRKMLMEVILPKETQQIDRLLSGFADRYHECNPGIFMSADEANYVAFSILLLQSDSHNKNNKRKMTRQDYIKNTQNGKLSVADDILDCFYDNICYTPFIHFDDEIALNSRRLGVPKRKGLIRSKSSEMLRGPIDPYTLILEQKLDILRPSLKDVIETEDPYSDAPINTVENHRAFVHAAILQIVSARSRPDAFTTQATITNPAEAQVGLVSIKVAKVGLLWRKAPKKKKAKSPWQEWGAVLTDSKLYFFKDIGWMKKLISQCEGHSKTGGKHHPLVFKPPLTSFEPDAHMGLDDAVALVDAGYKRHKNAFTFIKHGGFEEVFLANSDSEVMDWVSKLNYASTFRTAGVRMRGLLGTNYEGRPMPRKDSEMSTSTETSHVSEQQSTAVAVTSAATSTPGKTSPQLAWEIMFYRRQLVSERISTFDDHVATAQKELDYLLRNARHLLILLPIQQRTREAIVFAAGRMNAKLKWTRKEIWRARTHRDILIKDLEAEATSAFPASPSVSSRKPTSLTTPVKGTSKPYMQSLARTDTDQTLRSNVSKTPISATPIAAVSGRRPSQAVLQQIVTDSPDPPELHSTHRKSVSSVMPASPKSHVDPEGSIRSTRVRTPSIHTLSSQQMSVTSGGQTQQEDNADEDGSQGATSIASDATKTLEHRRHSDTTKDHTLPQTTAHTHLHEASLRDRAGSVRRSLQRTLRDSSSHMHGPHHTRSRKGKESGSSLAPTEDGRSIMSGESEELRRDPTGRFVLHGKKASVITMGPEWQVSNEERLKLREQMLNDRAAQDERGDLRIDTTVHGRKSEDRSPRDSQKPDISNRQSAAESHFSAYSAVTHPTGNGEMFHSAESSPQLGPSETQGLEPDSDDDSTFVKDENGLITGLKPVPQQRRPEGNVAGTTTIT